MHQSRNAAALDASAVALSTLCIIHCLFLPVVTAVLPLSAMWLEQEWVHDVFVLTALPISGYAIFVSLKRREGIGFGLAASVGLALLCAAAFLESIHDYEVPVTVMGGVVLAFAHLLRWYGRHRDIPTDY